MFHNSGGTMKMSPKTQYFLSKNYLVTIFKNLKFPAILITFPLECLLYLFMGMVKIVLRQRPLGLARIYVLVLPNHKSQVVFNQTYSNSEIFAQKNDTLF